MTADPRQFDYPLESPLQRLRWRLDEQLGALAKRVGALAELNAAAGALEAAIAAAARDAAPSPAGLVDLARARGALHYLVSLQARRAQVGLEVRRGEAAVATGRDALARTQRDVETLEQDRDDRLAEHLRDVDRRALGEADQDWMARASWRAAVARRDEVPR